MAWGISTLAILHAQLHTHRGTHREVIRVNQLGHAFLLAWADLHLDGRDALRPQEQDPNAYNEPRVHHGDQMALRSAS